MALFHLLAYFSSPLWAEVHRTESIVVQGQVKPQSSISQTGGMSSQLLDENTNTVQDVLASFPSVQSNFKASDGAPVWISIRGQEATQTRYFLEGISLTEAEFGRSPFHTIPLEALHRVEVFPVAAPGNFLSDGFGGAVNAKLTSSEAKPRFRGKYGSFASTSVGAYVPLRPGQLALQASRSDETFTYFDNNATPYNSSDDATKVRTQNGFWRVGVLPSFDWAPRHDWYVQGLALVTLGEQQLPGSIDRPSATRLDDNYLLVGLIPHYQSDPTLELSSHVAFKQYQENLEGESVLSLAVPQSSTSRTLEVKLGIEKEWTSRFTSEGAIGTQWDSVEVSYLKGELVNHNRFTLSASLAGGWKPWPNTSIQVAALGQSQTLNENVAGDTRAPKASEWLLVSPRVSLLSQFTGGPSKVVLRTTCGLFQRAPSLSERYGTSLGVSRSGTLKTENAEKCDAEIQWEVKKVSTLVERFSANVGAHVATSRDLIYLVSVSPNTSQYQNIGEAWIYGAEFSTEWGLAFDIELKSWLALLSSENLTPTLALQGKALPNRGHHARFELAKRIAGFRFGYQGEWVGPSFSDLNNSSRREGAWDHSLVFSWKSRSWGTFALDVRNIADRQTQVASVGSRQVLDINSPLPGYPNIGRRFNFQWRYEL